MKLYNEKHNGLSVGLMETLKKVRKLRGFNLTTYIKAKSTLLNHYMAKSGLDSCVVAISGGIDSATVLALVNHAKNQEGSPIKKIVAVTIPSFDGSVTNQKETVKKAKQLCKKLGCELSVLALTKDVGSIAKKVEFAMGKNNVDAWSRGQLVSYLRTPTLYYFTSVLNSQGFKPLLVGTINKDEGGYLGFLCRSGDGCVDVQLISDLHKSEVYQVAKFFGVPKSIINAAPSGDMYDGRIDEDVFGAPYDFVEIFLSFKTMTETTKSYMTLNWTQKDKEQWETYSQALEKLHRYNAHKYMSGSPAIHLDVINAGVPGGWEDGVHATIYKNNKPQIIQTHRFVGFVPESPKLTNKNLNLKRTAGEVQVVENILSEQEAQDILDWVKKNEAKKVRVNEYGYPKHSEGLGSLRLSFFDENFAKTIFERLKLSGAIEEVRVFEEKDKTNWRPYSQYRAVGINPLCRLIQYDPKTALNVHYDDSFYQSDTTRSLVTVVLVIQTSKKGGATRFIRDSQDNIPFEQRNFSDWDRNANDDEVYVKYKKARGALVFDHRLLHDGEFVEDGDKIIIRTDIMYEACDVLVK